MYSRKLSEMTRGWLVGNFEPSAYKTNDVEISVRELEKGYCEAMHYHRRATKIIVVLSGKVSMYGKEWQADDIIVMERGRDNATAIEAAEDAKIITMVFPGVKNDKVFVDSQRGEAEDDAEDLRRLYTEDEVRKLINIVGSVLNVPYIQTDHSNVKTAQDYTQMQKDAYENPNVTPEDIVGQYDWHEEYPMKHFCCTKTEMCASRFLTAQRIKWRLILHVDREEW